HFLADDGAQRPVLQPCDQCRVNLFQVGLGRVEQGHATNVGVISHGAAGVDLDAAAGADDDDAAAPGQDVEVLVEVDVGEHLDDDVDAAAVGEPHQVVEVGRRSMVEDVVSAVVGDESAAAV